MSKSRVIVLSVVHQGLTKAQAAALYGVSWRWVHTLVTRYHEGGLEAVDPRSSRPANSPHEMSAQVRQHIVALRRDLVSQGLDAGPITIAWHLELWGFSAPSTSSIRRVLVSEALVTPEPKKRPKSSLRRFEAAQPNETWQSDFTHWRLADNTDVEIINWLDDHSRFLLSMVVFSRVNGPIVVETFFDCVEKYGAPASTLTDNGVVYTTRLLGSRNAFEHVLAQLGVKQKNGKPNHPQTQGKIERFHQTLKKWLREQPSPQTLEELQEQLDRFREIYNEHRPHKALQRRTPGTSYRATAKATSGSALLNEYRVRYDTVDRFGKITLRHAAIVHHLGIGREHARAKVLILVDETTVTVTRLTTGEILSQHQIDETKNYWRNHLRQP